MADIILSEFFSYDPSSPSFLRWKINLGRRIKSGDSVGSISSYGYWRTKLQGKEIPVHRIIWQLHYGEIPECMQVDHIDGIRVNNDICNLRLASVSENLQNQKRSSKNTTGVKGLSWNNADRAWRGSVQIRGVRNHFSSKSRTEVEDWLRKTRNDLHGDFARHQ